MTVSAPRVRKRVIDPLELEFQAVMICLIGRLRAELALSARAVCTLNG